MDALTDTRDFCAAVAAGARAALAERQLAALAAREQVVRAFVCCDAGAARDNLAQPSSGPLAGALVGVKDIICTADFPTRYGSRDCDDAGPRHDAWCVAETRRLGGTVLGKTVCTQFAYPLPGPTTNPHDARRTPGGSSSGSAAAVAAGFVAFALGTQTAASIIRPASYCGVTGYKPTYGLLHTEGVQAIAVTLDHVGVFARSPRDAWYFASAMILGSAEVAAARPPRRLLMLRLPSEVPHTDGYRERMSELAAWLRREGVDVTAIDLPFALDDFMSLQQKLCYWEAARVLRVPGPVRPVAQLQALLAPYGDMDIARYQSARARRQACQGEFAALAAGYDAVLTPAATGAAPGVGETGDAIMSRFWTALHVPAMAVPMWSTQEGLPLGLQLLGGLGADRPLAETAQWLFERSTAAGRREPAQGGFAR
jgi:Asp-tRNA(Asn)/Glu-tRNA(Gln) amidotransferase A subunit family amidase